MIKNKIEGLIKSERKFDNKQKIESIVFLIIVLVLTVIAINSIWNTDKKTNNEITNTNKKLASSTEEINIEENSDKLEKSLEEILSSMSGVGKSKVFINYSESSTVEAMYNETTKESSTEETDDTGGVRTIQQTDTQKDVIYSEEGNSKTPVTQKVTNPTIEGAIVTAEGADDSSVKSNIINAVSAATGLASHKIQVFKMNSMN